MGDNNGPPPPPPDANQDVQMPPRHMVRIDQPLSYYKTERLGRVALPIDNTTNPTARHDRNSSSLIAHIIAGLPNVFQNNVQVQMPPDLFSVSYERDRNFGAFIAVMPISFATFLIENGNHIGYFNIRGTDGTAYKLHYCEYIASPERRIGFKQNTVNWYWINLPPACVLTTDELRELMAKHVAIAGLKQTECERPLERLVFFPLGSPRHTPPQPQCRAHSLTRADSTLMPTRRRLPPRNTLYKGNRMRGECILMERKASTRPTCRRSSASTSGGRSSRSSLAPSSATATTSTASA